MRKILTLGLILSLSLGAMAKPKKVVMIAGPRSHGPLSHEHRAGIMLLAKCLKEGAADLVQPTVVTNGFPKDVSVFNGADAVVIYSDGGGRHPALGGNNLETLGKLVKKEDWNTFRIEAKDFHLTHYINGEKMTVLIDNDEKTRRADGLLALQLHAGPPMTVQFRNIRVKNLK